MNTNEEIKEGDVVVLKSGGPKMTVKKFAWNPSKGEYSKDKVECTWFEESKLLEGSFYLSEIKKYVNKGAKIKIIGD
jgi:uncharacterized protein YodC (DUF2158 family)